MTLKTSRDLLFSTVGEAIPRLVAREKPVQTSKIIGIIVGVVSVVIIGSTLTVVLFFHRRKKRNEQKEDAALDLELDGEFEDYPGGVARPKPSRSKQPKQQNLQHQLRQQQNTYDSDEEVEMPPHRQHMTLEEQLNQQHPPQQQRQPQPQTEQQQHNFV